MKDPKGGMKMNETLKTILNRRTIRKFTDQSVCQSTLSLVLAAACAAPSACNARPVRYVVLDKSRMKDLADALEQKEPFLQGQWAVAVCADTRGYQFGTAWMEDCAAAMENMQIACWGLGLGALWFGVYRRAAKEGAVRRCLKLPEGVEVLGITVMGYAAEEKEPHSATPDESVIRRGVWSD